MSRIFVLGLIITVLSGCITTQPGNFSSAPVSLTQTMATDSVRQLSVLYPPARTRFVFKQSTQDAFGKSLINSLRQKGYSLVETQGGQQTNVLTISETPLRYVVDEPIKNSLYRVTIRVGQQSISRAYRLKKGILKSAGFWVRQEY